MHHFHINEFAVDSEFRLSAASSTRVAHARKRPRVSVRREPLDSIHCLMRRVRPSISYDVGTGILFEPRHIRLFVSNAGDSIVVEAQDEHLPMAGLWVMHLGLALCTLFHGGLPLHGAGLELDGHYFAVMANSGGGKSTLTASMVQHGARFGNDDLVPVRFTESGPVAWPSFSLSPKVHRTALERFGIDWRPMPLAPGEELEHYLTIEPYQRIPGPGPLHAVFVLYPAVDAPDGVTVHRLADAEARMALSQNMHGVWAAGSHLDHRVLAPLLHRLTMTVPVYALRYARSFVMLPQLIDTIRGALADPDLAEIGTSASVC